MDKSHTFARHALGKAVHEGGAVVRPPAAINSDSPHASHRRALLTLAAMSLGFVVVQLDVTVVNVALKSIGGALGGGIQGLRGV
jgi:DHA2 family methylenomycin A resistance protein-like MFS transporter